MADADLIAPIRVAAPKPRMTVYYAMLILSLLAMLTACGFLYAEIRRFGGFGTVPQRISSYQPISEFLCHREHRVHREGFQKVDFMTSVFSVANS
jgi:hypothetical protein